MFRRTTLHFTGRQLTLAPVARIVRCFVCYLPLLLVLVPAARAQTSATDGKTPAGLAPGSPAGSYPLSGFETVNLFNGGLNFRLPLVKVGGRGSAGYAVTLPVEQKWVVKAGQQTPGSVVPLAPNPNWWQGIRPGYGPGVLHGRRGSYEDGRTEESYGCDAVGQGCSTVLREVDLRTLTRLTFTASDGTEYELRDRPASGAPEGAPHAEIWYPETGNRDGFNRGKVFVTADGNSATFISDADIKDYVAPNMTQTQRLIYPSGQLLLSDGTRYRIDSGTVTWISDSNGNRVTFAYGAAGRVSSATDSLGRQVTFTYDDGVRHYDEVSFYGFGGAARTLRVWYDSLSNRLRPNSGYSAQTYYQLFPLNSASTTQYNPQRVSEIELPDHRRYKLYYNPYGEPARVELPAGGAVEYDWAGVVDATDATIFRHVTKRRVYPNGGAAWESQTEYVRAGDGTNSSVEEKTTDAAGALLARVVHYFHGDAPESLAEDPARPAAISYSKWREGREYRTESFDVVSGTPVLKRVVEQTWRQPLAGAAWPLSGQGETDEFARPNDPQVTEVKTTLSDTDQASKQSFAYDRYGNRTDTWEYDFKGSGDPWQLLRHTHTDFVTANVVDGIAYDYACDPTTTCNDGADMANVIHLRGLPLRSWVTADAGAANKQSLIEYEYDNYADDARHKPLVPRADITQLGAAYDASYKRRGNVTGVTSYADAPHSADAVSAYSQYDVAGNIVRAIDARGFATELAYDDNFGMPNDSARDSAAPSGLNGKHTFAFVTQTTNSLGHTARSQYDYDTGQAVNSEDINGIVTRLTYGGDDPLDRLTQVERAASDPDRHSQTTYSYDDANRKVTTTSDLDAYGDNVLKGEAFYDGLGRTTAARRYEGGAQYVETRTKYDALGRASEVSNPFRPVLGESPVWTQTAYDALGRVSTVTTPDGAKVYTLYDGPRTLVTDQARKQRISKLDALGRLTEVWEVRSEDTESGTVLVAFPVPQGGPVPEVSSGYRTAYTYDVLGNLRTVTQGVQTRSFVYNSLSRLTSASNPESGTAEYRYDANGNLTLKIDPRPRAGGVTLSNCSVPYTGGKVATCYEYDLLNRIKSRKYNDGTPDVTYTYDDAVVANSKGRLTSVVSSVSTYSYTAFDPMGRVTATSQTTGGVTYTMPEYKYDLAGNLTSEKYPSGRVVETQYDAGGRVAGVKRLGGDYYAGGDPNVTNNPNVIRYAPQGGVAALRLGNGLWERTEYNNRLQPERIRLGTQSAANSVLQLDYGYGTNVNNGNLLNQTITVPASGTQPGLAFTQVYSYDALNRLESAREASGSSEVWKQTYSYDRYGNRTLNASQTTLPKLTAPGQTASPAAANPSVQAATNRFTEDQDGDGAKEYTYDEGGNMTCEARYCGSSTASPYYKYDAENRLIGAGGGAPNGGSSYLYDGVGRRVKKDVGASVTVFVYDAAGRPVAEYGGTQASSGGTSYLTQDHLGSTRVVTGQGQEVRGQYDYLPFGEEIYAGRSGYGSTTVRQKFTGYERDETSLDYAKARYYFSGQGRFMSVDPFNIILETEATASFDPEKAEEQFTNYLTHAQQWNRYAYVGNNPLNYVDPTGEKLELTGRNEGERSQEFERIKKLVGANGAKLLYVREENGHYYVDYRGKDSDALAATSDIGVIVADIINSAKTTEYHIATEFDTKYGHYTTAYFGGAATVGAEESTNGNTQIFVHPDSGNITTEKFGMTMLGRAKSSDGRQLDYFDDIDDAHEFGHAWKNVKHGVPLYNCHDSDAFAVQAENVVRARRKLNLRKIH